MKLQKKIFITGTDTDVGKTLFTAALIKLLIECGQSVMAFKPIAAGCELILEEKQPEDDAFVNDDALTLIKSMGKEVSYQIVNPIALKSAIAPHIAASQMGCELSIKKLQSVILLDNHKESFLLLEGAGGWLVPLNQNETYADYVESELLEVILVVGLRLGCINHALLTQNNILSRGLKLVGWVANHIDPDMQNQQENIQTLKQSLQCPLIAEIPYITEPSDLAGEELIDGLISQASKHVDLSVLLK